jgi:hypothetical protein
LLIVGLDLLQLEDDPFGSPATSFYYEYMSITNQSSAFAWTVNYARSLNRKSQLEIAGAARLRLKEYIALEQGRYIPRLWQVLLLADALDLDREWLCRLATAESEMPKKRAAAAGVSLRIPGQHRCA